MGDQTSEVKDLERVLNDTSAEPIQISYASIKYITKNFAHAIGYGRFGVVYLGGLQNGVVAVKKFVTSKDFTDKQFFDDVTCLKRVNHRNIVRFIGYCAHTPSENMEVEGKHWLLCFEYTPHGNLHRRYHVKEMGDQTSELENLERIITDPSAEPIQISYVAIKYITKNFVQKIGAGGFAEVYMGSLQNGMVAVKKVISKDFSDKQFLDEVTCLKKVNHRNIVRFIGYCADAQGEVMEVKGKLSVVEVPQRLLCFEYVPNGDLHHYVKEKTYGYEWSVCYQIIKGIVQGLHYIHEKCINHLDLKPANVLLGANMEPKITDFGVSRCIDEHQTTMVTKNLFGTLGYIAPEFIDKGRMSFKSDIFSLGVIMINLLTGCNGCVTENWHDTIDVDIPQPDMKRCIEIAQACVNRDPHKRPTTGEIIYHLNETEKIVPKNHAIQIYKPIVNEPINDPRSSLHQIVHRFQALPAATVWDNYRSNNLDKDVHCLLRDDTLNMELDVPECIPDLREKSGKLPYYLLQFITGNFSDERKIGDTGLAVIFRGIHRQQSIAVKRFRRTTNFYDEIFHNEVKVMLLAQHTNIVQFLGYCSYTEEEAIEYQGEVVMAAIRERLLCFEYLSNRSLDHYVSDASCGLEWRERYKIIKGICEGVHYLHGKNIVHMDLNPGNILLNYYMVPRIANFSLSRCLGENQSQITTKNRDGTLGYMAPEFLLTGVITFKSDIYSLGIIIAEILTGCSEDSAIENVLQIWRKRLEKSRKRIAVLEQVRVCAALSILCKNKDPEKRPDTGRIIKTLTQTERSLPRHFGWIWLAVLAAVRLRDRSWRRADLLKMPYTGPMIKMLDETERRMSRHRIWMVVLEAVSRMRALAQRRVDIEKRPISKALCHYGWIWVVFPAVMRWVRRARRHIALHGRRGCC